MPNETCGHLLCPMCETRGEIRRYKNHARGKMYIACACGQIRPALNQAYILRNGEFIPAHALAPEAASIAEAKAAHEAKRAAKPNNPLSAVPAPAGERAAGPEATSQPVPAPKPPEPPPKAAPVTKPKPVNGGAPPPKPVNGAKPQPKPVNKTDPEKKPEPSIFGGLSLWQK